MSDQLTPTPGSRVLFVGVTDGDFRRIQDLLRLDGYVGQPCRRVEDVVHRLDADRFLMVVVACEWWSSLDTETRSRMVATMADRSVCFFGERSESGEPLPAGVVTARSDGELLAHVHRFAAERLGEAFRQSETRFRMMLEQVPAILWTTDRELRFTSSMGAGLTALGHKPNDVVGIPLVEYFAVGEDEPIQVVHHHKALAGESVQYEDLWVNRYYQVHIEPLRDGDGGIIGCLGVALDVTRRRLAEEAVVEMQMETEARVVLRTAELRDANERLKREIADRRAAEAKLREKEAQIAHVSRLSTLGEIATGMAHELNQPLAAIANYAHGSLNRLREAPQVPDGVVDALEQIDRQTGRAAQIISRLRSMVKRRKVEPTMQNLAVLAREAIELVEVNARRHGVELQLQCDDQTPRVRVDSTELVQVIVNLLCNAIDASANGEAGHRPVQIRTAAQPAEFVTLTVMDRGVGLTDESELRAFDTFYTSKQDGLGLGLPISRTIVESYGGRLWGRRNIDGPGATFGFSLPLAFHP